MSRDAESLPLRQTTDSVRAPMPRLVQWLDRRIARVGQCCESPLATPLFWTLALGAIVSTAAYIQVYGVNVPFWDEWIVVDMVRRHLDGTYHWAQIWGLHNEHRLVWPKLFYLAEFHMLGDHLPKFCMFVCLGLLGALLPMLAREASAEQPQFPARVRRLLFIPVVWMLPSPRQFENLLWGFQITFVSAAFFAVACLWTLSRLCAGSGMRTRAWLLLAAGTLATLASFSSVMGLIVWWVGLALLSTCRGRRWPWMISWGCAAVAVWLVYFHGYVKPPQHPELAPLLRRPFAFVYFFLATVGAPAAPIPPLAALCGLLICGYIAFRMWRAIRSGRHASGVFWIAVALFGFCTALSITIGRSGFGILQSTPSRYITFTLLSTISCYVLLVGDAIRLWRRRPRTYSLAPALLAAGLFAATLLSGAVWGVRGGRHLRARNLDALDVLSRLETATDDELLRVFPNAPFCRRNAAFAKQRGLTPFPLAEPSP